MAENKNKLANLEDLKIVHDYQEQKSKYRITALANSEVANESIIEAVGIPIYLNDFTDYSAYGLSEAGWYVFGRVNARPGDAVTAETTVEGAAGYISEVGETHIDLAIRFGVTAASQRVTISWGNSIDTYVFKATDLAIRNLDYRTTFYIYDAAPYVTWTYALETSATFESGIHYYTKNGDVYSQADVPQGNAGADANVPAYYILVDETYTQATGVFESGVTYYTKVNNDYAEAEVTVGDPIPAYYKHSKVTISGLARNITYRLNDLIDCPMEFILPNIEDETHGCWFEIRCRHAGEYSMTLVPPSSDVKVATEHTQKETAGINVIDLHYTSIDGVKLWRFLNTHSSIPTT